MLQRYYPLERLTIGLTYGQFNPKEISSKQGPAVRDAAMARVVARFRSLIEFL